MFHIRDFYSDTLKMDTAEGTLFPRVDDLDDDVIFGTKFTRQSDSFAVLATRDERV